MTNRTYPWIVSFIIRDPRTNEKQPWYLKVVERDLQHAITKACHKIEDKYRRGVDYFVHDAGLAQNDEGLNEFCVDTMSELEGIEW